MAVAFLGVTATIWLTIGWLLSSTREVLAHDQKASGTDRAQVRVEVVRTGLAAGAGVGAAFGLMLALRRQHHQELATVLSQLDATERRITDLYNAAAEQLGSDRAPVRLTALYTLERLANDNPGHRQTIVNIICAYLRMPWTLPDQDKPPQAEVIRNHYRAYKSSKAGRIVTQQKTLASTTSAHEEREVRLTAQRILSTRLREGTTPSSTTADPWQHIDLDLTGATLINFDLRFCTVRTALFNNATFIGKTWFIQTTFLGNAMFTGTTFAAAVEFTRARFLGSARFNAATFDGFVRFHHATFSRTAWFKRASFNGSTSFQNAIFNASSVFERVNFGTTVSFRKTRFDGAGRFHRAQFRYNPKLPPKMYLDSCGVLSPVSSSVDQAREAAASAPSRLPPT